MGCVFHGVGTTKGKRKQGLVWRVDTGLHWVTESDGEVASNEELLEMKVDMPEKPAKDGE